MNSAHGPLNNTDREHFDAPFATSQGSKLQKLKWMNDKRNWFKGFESASKTLMFHEGYGGDVRDRRKTITQWNNLQRVAVYNVDTRFVWLKQISVTQLARPKPCPPGGLKTAPTFCTRFTICWVRIFQRCIGSRSTDSRRNRPSVAGLDDEECINAGSDSSFRLHQSISPATLPSPMRSSNKTMALRQQYVYPKGKRP